MTDRFGIAKGYEDAFGVRRRASAATIESLERAMCAHRPPPSAVVPIVIDRRKRRWPKTGNGTLVLEDGSRLAVTDKLPKDIPLGYHDFYPDGEEQSTRLIVSPGECHPPPAELAWGWAVQLYAARSRESWGMGDLADLRTLASWSRSEGAKFLLVNPLPAVDPVTPQESSPYYPTSRRFRNPLYLRIEEVPRADMLGGELVDLARESHALNGDRLLRRDEVFHLKQAALRKLWEHFPGDPEFDQFRREQGETLTEFATYCALVEEFGPDWLRWDVSYRRPDAAGIARFAVEHAQRIEYHEWLQWLVDRQLASAAAELPIVQDMPIGFNPRGADAWTWQDILATGVSVGAPPDLYNTQGQNWGFPPFIPHQLAAARYEPFIQTIRALLRHAGGLRIDHVLGLFRLFWIPESMSPVDGTYVAYPVEDLLNIISLESHRSQAFVVGEDLGTVGRNVRALLANANMLSYRLLWFETDSPRKYPKLAMSAVTTHDLPTVAGLWTSSDLQKQEALGLKPNAAAVGAIRKRLRETTGLADDAAPADVVGATYELLAQVPSVVVTATLEDAMTVEERPNMPATSYEQWPNWCISLPEPIESLRESPTASRIARSLSQRSNLDASAGETQP